MMPKIDGIEVCRRLKADPRLPFMPIILVTAKADSEGRDRRARRRRRRISDQADRPDGAGRARQVDAAPQGAARPGAARRPPISRSGTGRSSSASPEQVAEIERMSRLKRFLSPQIAELILSSGEDRVLESHRRDITVVFCDLRGFTAFAETAEPEEVMSILGEYHARARRADPQIRGHDRALCRRRRDDPVQRSRCRCPDPEPARRADGARDARPRRRALGRNGASTATSSASASASRTAMPRSAASASRVASTMPRSARSSISRRACARRPKNGQILIDGKVQTAIDASADIEPAGELTLKGFQRPVRVFNVCGLQTAPA